MRNTKLRPTTQKKIHASEWRWWNFNYLNAFCTIYGTQSQNFDFNPTNLPPRWSCCNLPAVVFSTAITKSLILPKITTAWSYNCYLFLHTLFMVPFRYFYQSKEVPFKAMNIIINKTHGSTECRWRGSGRWRWTVEAECSGAHNVCANYSHLLLFYTILTMHFIP